MDSPLALLRQDIDDAISVGVIPLITGESGVGKTAMVREVARRRKLPLYTLIGSIEDPTSINGFPVVDDADVLDSLGRRRKVIRFAPRDFLVEINEKHDGRALIFFDELTSTAPATAAALLRTMMDKVFGDYALDPYKMAMVAACNPPDLAANGQEIPLPMSNRLMHLTYPCDHAAAVEWAANFVSYWGNPVQVGFDGEFVSEESMIRARALVGGFIVKNPSWWHYTLTEAGGKDARKHESADFAGGTVGVHTARSWDRVSWHLGMCLQRHQSPYTIQRRVIGEVGSAAASLFQVHLQNSEIPDPEEILKNPKDYRPTNRPDVDFTVMGGVTAAVERNSTPERLLACMQICRNVVDYRGSYEAGALAVGRLAKLLDAKSLKAIADKARLKPEMLLNLKRDLAELLKPFMAMSRNVFNDLNRGET